MLVEKQLWQFLILFLTSLCNLANLVSNWVLFPP